MYIACMVEIHISSYDENAGASAGGSAHQAEIHIQVGRGPLAHERPRTAQDKHKNTTGVHFVTADSPGQPQQHDKRAAEASLAIRITARACPTAPPP